MAASAILLMDVVCDGPAALKLFRRHAYGLASLDYKMQGMDSVELFPKLQTLDLPTRRLQTHSLIRLSFCPACGAGGSRCFQPPSLARRKKT